MRDDKWTKIANDLADGKTIVRDSHDKVTGEEKQWLDQLYSLDKISKAFGALVNSNKPKDHETHHEYLFTWGHLQVVEKIGEGNFGEVYRSYDPILDRQVALKLFKKDGFLSLQSRHLIAEAKRLAKVRNEHVLAVHGANIYDDRAGMWSDLVIGHNLSHEEYQNECSLDVLFELMISLSNALQAVHNAQIVHGDIKPSNVMRQEHGKYILMDFGAGADRSNNVHNDESVSGTPLFLAPEIVLKDSKASSESDIYAFGVLLYKLATQSYPIKANNVADVYFAHENQKYHMFGTLRKDIPTTIKSIIEKMLSVNPQIRPSASAIYQQLLWIKDAPKRRNKKLVVMTIIATLLIGMVISSIGLYHANESRKIAEIEKENAQSINRFLGDMLGSAANSGRGKETKITDMLAIAANDIDNRFHNKPRIKVATLEAIGTSYQHLVLPEKSIELFSQSLELKKKWLKQDAPEVLNIQLKIAHSYHILNEFDKSIELINQVLMQANKKTVTNKHIIDLAHIRLANNYSAKGEFNKAEILYNSVISQLNNSEQALFNIAYLAYQGLSNNYISQSKYKQALEMADKAQIEHEKWPNSSITNLMVIKDIQAKALVKLGRYIQAEKASFETVKLTEKHFGRNNPAFLNTLSNYSAILQEQGHIEKALPLQLQALELSNQLFGYGNEVSIKVYTNIANIKVSMGLLEEGESIMRNTLKIAKEKIGESHMDTLTLEYNLSELLNKNKKYQEALKLAKINHNKMKQALGAKHLYTLLSLDNIAVSLAGLNQMIKAEIMFKQIINDIKQTIGTNNPYMILVQKHFVDLLIESKQNQSASIQLQVLIDLQEKLIGSEHEDTINSIQKLKQIMN